MWFSDNFYSLGYYRFTLLLLLYLFSAIGFTQEYIFDSEIINVEDGLPHRIVYDIKQDSKGFIWISTPNTISRYDGHRFKSYDLTDYGFPARGIPKFAIDKYDRIWYTLFDPGHFYRRTESFTARIEDLNDEIILAKNTDTFQSILQGNWVADINQGHSNTILLTLSNGLIYNFDEQLNLLVDFGNYTSIPRYSITANNTYYFFDTKKVVQVDPSGLIDSATLTYNIRRSIPDNSGIMLELTNGDDFTTPYMTYNNGALQPFYFDGIDSIENLLFIEDDKIAYTKNGQFIIFSTLTKEEYTSEKQKAEQSLNQYAGYPLGIFKDRSGLYWVGTEDGMLKITLKRSGFSALQPKNSIRHIYHDGKDLWIGGYAYNDLPDTSLLRFTQRFRDYGIPFSFYEGLEGTTWIHMKNHLFRYNHSHRQFRHFPLEVAGNNFLLFQDNETQKVWIAADNNLYHFEINNSRLTRFGLLPFESILFHFFYKNQEGIWLGTNKGIFLLDRNGEKLLKHYDKKHGLPNHNITHLHEDEDGIFWLATRQAGLIRWDRQQQVFRSFTTEGGLSHNTIHAVYEHENVLWMPSDYGLMAFDKETYTTEVYFPRHGTAHEEFNYRAHHQAKDGMLYFGGLNGVTTFNPDKLTKEFANIPLQLVKIQVLEDGKETYEDRTDSYRTNNTIKLSSKDNILSIDLSLLDYKKTADHQYAYRINGKQVPWIYTNEPTLSLIHPPFGQYNLQIKARGSNGVWSKQEITIPLIVQKPLYIQLWFWAIIFVLVAIAVFSGIRWRISRLEQAKHQLEVEVKKRTQTIREQAEELQQLDKAKTRFFSNVTHEFRTPLTLIIGPLEQVIENQPPPRIFKRRLNGVLNNARHLLTLVNQMLDISKIESGRMDTRVSRGDIVEYTKLLTQHFDVLLEKKRHRFSFVCNQTNWETHFDIDKWNKIIYNLLSNAVKFTPEGQTIQLSLLKTIYQGQETIRLDVKDTGIGLEPKQLRKVFNRFYQVDDSSRRTVGGTGIGMALVKELVELQGGEIWVFSQPNAGTTFELYIPVLQRAAENQSVVSNLVAPTLPIFNNKEIGVIEKAPVLKRHATEKLDILLIEDNEEIREYVRHCLDVDKYDIIEAANGEEGLLKAQSIVPDLIVSDVMMPKRNGFEVVQEIRQNLATSHIPVILLTAKASLKSRLEGLKRGADAYLSKPFSPQELALRIEKLTELRQLIQQRYQGNTPTNYDETYQKEDQFITDLHVYILENLDQTKLNGDQVGRHFGMSRVHLYRKLKALTNQSISEFVKQIRLQKAKELLLIGELNVSEIAYQTGFSSVSYFSRSFKKAYGKAPSEM